MSVELPYGIKVVNPLPVDHYYDNAGSPYADTAAAIAAIPQPVRYRGLTVNVSGDEYWWRDGTADGDLVPKITKAMVGYTHTQGSGALIWYVGHNLGRCPIVQVRDNGGQEFKGEIVHTDSNNLTITFGFALAGVAECR